ncbi:hypothetical protein [Lactococcus garvieae]|uniref:hypothetical protein n=1 Tax=Lactococcus garvieae TaxID=1363 RepID=UPI00254C9C5B|nr:hypothetical protein [Lactococcus garvieae]
MINKRINTTIPEEVISLFLNKTQIKKLLILDMIDADNIPLKYLESVFSISKNRTRKFAERFVDEINSYGIDTIEYLTIVNDEIQVNSVLEPYHYIELVSLIRKTYKHMLKIQVCIAF